MDFACAFGFGLLLALVLIIVFSALEQKGR